MEIESSRGPEIPADEDLLRGIIRPEWWDPVDKHLSSGIFGFPTFSAFIASMTTQDAIVAKFPDGSGVIQFNAGTARSLGFDARHEPEEGDNSHANVYCDMNSNQRKKRARKLVQEATVTKEPDVARLKGSG